jgi:multidrug efflux pump subunit AcrB
VPHRTGGQEPEHRCRPGGKPSIGLAVYQLPGSNALDVAEKVKAKMRV